MKKISFFIMLVIITGITCGICSLKTYAKESGLVKDGYDYYYYDKKGNMYTDKFVKIGDKTYYFDDEGKMIKKDFLKKGDKYYYFDKDGVRQTGWLELEYLKDFYTVFNYPNLNIADGLHYFRSDGTMVYDALLKSGDKTYGFDAYGVKQVDKYGMVAGKVYKFDKNGNKRNANLKTIADVKQYLKEGYGVIFIADTYLNIDWMIFEGDKQDNPYDYSIRAEVSPVDYSSSSHKTRSELSRLLYKMGDPEKYTDSERDAVNKTLQKVIISAVKAVQKVDSEAKIEAYYYEYWWTYSEKWRVYTNDSHSQKWLVCNNYETTDENKGEYGYTTYKRTKKIKLRWISNSKPCQKNS